VAGARSGPLASPRPSRIRSWLRLLRSWRTARPTGGGVKDIKLADRTLELLPVLIGGRHPLERIDSGTDDAPSERTQCSRYLVVHPHAVTAGGNQSAFSQVRQMA